MRRLLHTPHYPGGNVNESGGYSVSRVILIVLAIVAVIGSITLLMSCGTVKQDEVGFKVGGGYLDPSRGKVKGDMLPPGRHILGTFDTLWTYPAYRTLRFEDFSVPVTTKDGKRIVLDGQVNFRFVGEKDPDMAKAFALGLGARKYGGQRPGDSGGEGWNNMLDQLMLPEIVASLKEQIGADYCADFEPACRSIDPRQNVPDTDSERVYREVAALLDKRLTEKLGAPYFREVFLRIKRIELQPEVQRAIDRVTAEQAKTKAAQQSEQTASAEAAAIRIKGRAIRANPKLVGVEIVKNCPASCTVIVDGSGKGVAAAVGK